MERMSEEIKYRNMSDLGEKIFFLLKEFYKTNHKTYRIRIQFKDEVTTKKVVLLFVYQFNKYTGAIPLLLICKETTEGLYIPEPGYTVTLGNDNDLSYTMAVVKTYIDEQTNPDAKMILSSIAEFEDDTAVKNIMNHKDAYIVREEQSKEISKNVPKSGIHKLPNTISNLFLTGKASSVEIKFSIRLDTDGGEKAVEIVKVEKAYLVDDYYLVYNTRNMHSDTFNTRPMCLLMIDNTFDRDTFEKDILEVLTNEVSRLEQVSDNKLHITIRIVLDADSSEYNI